MSQRLIYPVGVHFETHNALCPLPDRERLKSELHRAVGITEFPAMHKAENVGCKTPFWAHVDFSLGPSDSPLLYLTSVSPLPLPFSAFSYSPSALLSF